ncbi:MAG: MFS transporter [Actinomycetota bacterium]
MTQDAVAADEAAPSNALRVRSFRYLWLNSISFALVMNATRFVYGWVVLDGLNRSESEQGLVVFLLGIPTLVLVLPAGVWADRLDRRWLLLGTQGGGAVVLFATAVLIGQGELSMAMIVVSALALGSILAIGSPVRSSLIPELLPRELLYSGIALNALAMTGSMVVGAVVAQIVGDAFGFDGVFAYLGVLMVLGVAAIQRMDTPPRHESTGAVTMRAAVREGLSFVARDPALRTLFGLLALAGMVMNALMFVTVQAFVKEDLGRDAGDAAPLFGLIGVGLAVGSTIVMRRGNMPNKGTVFLRAMTCGTFILALMGRTTAFWQIATLCLFMGVAGGFFINMNQGLIQSNTPAHLMGRVMGLFALVQAGLTPIGALAFGVLADAIGPGDTITWAAGGAFVVTVATYARAKAIHQIA